MLRIFTQISQKMTESSRHPHPTSAIIILET
jgi:hypothetical protein